MKKIYLFITILCFSISSNAQINEIGIFIGGSNYIGDIGKTNYVNPNELAVGVIFKWNMNPRIAFRGTFTTMRIAADDLESSNLGRYERGINFSNTINELAFGVEFNYLDYDISSHDKSYTPYVFLELAAFNYKGAVEEISPSNYTYENKTSYALPFGVGIKTKFFNSFAISLEVRVRYTFEDDLDYNNIEIPSLQFGNPNSNDWYMATGISFVYTFGRPPCFVNGL